MPSHDPRAALSRRVTVSSITITKQAEDAILKACRDPAAQGAKQRKGSIPLLLWSKRSYFVSNSGDRTEFGPQFYFYWTDRTEIERSNYATVLSRNFEIALSPGDLFREGLHQIDIRDGKLVLNDWLSFPTRPSDFGRRKRAWRRWKAGSRARSTRSSRFAWASPISNSSHVGDDAIDPLQQAQTLNILVTAGIETREDARAELGLGGEGKAAALGADEASQGASAFHSGRRLHETIDSLGVSAL
jgi:hypothetical protein